MAVVMDRPHTPVQAEHKVKLSEPFYDLANSLNVSSLRRQVASDATLALFRDPATIPQVSPELKAQLEKRINNLPELAKERGQAGFEARSQLRIEVRSLVMEAIERLNNSGDRGAFSAELKAIEGLMYPETDPKKIDPSSFDQYFPIKVGTHDIKGNPVEPPVGKLFEHRLVKRGEGEFQDRVTHSKLEQYLLAQEFAIKLKDFLNGDNVSANKARYLKLQSLSDQPQHFLRLVSSEFKALTGGSLADRLQETGVNGVIGAGQAIEKAIEPLKEK